MRPSPNLLRVAFCLSSLAPTVLAWPEWMPARDSLIVRQEDEDEDASSTAETGATASKTGAEATNTADKDEDEDEDEDGDDLNTAKPTSKDSKAKETGTKTGDSDKPKSSKSVPHDAAVGAVNIQEPTTTAVATQLFKIGDNVTLSWNYTGIVNEPTAIDILVSCSTASSTWTLTSNMTYETEVAYLWDTRDQKDELLTEMYTLIIKDAEADISEAPSPGELGAYSDFTFGMYQPVEYTPWPDWECTGCSGASAIFDVRVVKLAMTMCLITIFSFTWFAAGFGLQ